jgi:hypothetical protein
MKYILLLLILSLTSGCISLRTPVEHQAAYEAANIAANDGQPPTMFLGMKLYPHAARNILMTPPASLSGGGGYYESQLRQAIFRSNQAYYKAQMKK